jgi:TolB-like protein/AraC-like DNA-binding protein
MSSRDEIIEQLTKVVEENLGNEGFGVEDLAEKLSVSRSTLLRTIKKHTGMSANQFIKEVRLEQANVLISESEKTVAEISFETGFSSPSYFIKCYKEKYGYSPGVSRQGNQVENTIEQVPKIAQSKSRIIQTVVAAVAIITVISIVTYLLRSKEESSTFSGKSIAVLPFKNESADSSNVYFVNGMMESILSHLQKIEDLRVISRTSVEKYRKMNTSIPDIAADLNVDYVLEGSGQKSGDDILLTVQLIEAKEDRHLWSEQYNRKLADVFKLQATVSRKIADEIEVVIKPEVNNQIESVPTENLEAYDMFLKGQEFIKGQSEDNLDSAIKYYQKAIALDSEFANPYAYVAICLYYKDLFKAEKKNLDELDAYADKALLLNSELPEALIARGLYYMHRSKFEDAKKYFEKVLEFSPNSAWTHNFLSEIYHLYIPNTEKYLIHALSALKLDLSTNDSADVSITHLILANAFVQSGIMDKAKRHVNISLDYDPRNTFSRYLEIFIDLANGADMDQSIDRMASVYQDDTTRLDVLKELATLYYGQRNYELAYTYFNKFIRSKELYGFNLFPDKDITIAYVLRENGDTARAATYRKSFASFVDQNSTIYKSFLKTLGLLYDGEKEKALDSFEEFSKEEDYMYWLLLIEDDPIFGEVKDDPRFINTYNAMKSDFEVRKSERIAMLKERGLWE